MTEGAPLLRLRSLRRWRGAPGTGFCVEVPQLDVRAGQCIAVVGASGCGKSTLLDVLALSLAPSDADVFDFTPANNCVDVTSLWRPAQSGALASLRRQHIGYVLQTGGLLPFLSARDNIVLLAPAVSAGALDEVTRALDLDSGLLARKPAALSIGERQRVAIARAVIKRPQLVLADEPTASLDPVNADATLALFAQAVRERDMACVLVTHNEALARQFGFEIHRLVPQMMDGGGVRSLMAPAPQGQLH